MSPGTCCTPPGTPRAWRSSSARGSSSWTAAPYQASGRRAAQRAWPGRTRCLRCQPRPATRIGNREPVPILGAQQRHAQASAAPLETRASSSSIEGDAARPAPRSSPHHHRRQRRTRRRRHGRHRTDRRRPLLYTRPRAAPSQSPLRATASPPSRTTTRQRWPAPHRDGNDGSDYLLEVYWDRLWIDVTDRSL